VLDRVFRCSRFACKPRERNITVYYHLTNVGIVSGIMSVHVIFVDCVRLI